jgi:sarcosine oxidase subunit beta
MVKTSQFEQTMRQQKTADFIIIGGGIIGCSTAYNLVNQGAKNVVVLEKGEICSGGTAKSCAITRSHYSIEANLHHAVESIKILALFALNVDRLSWIGHSVSGTAKSL